MAPLLQLPEIPSAYREWLKGISFVLPEQLRAVPLQTVMPPPTTVHMYVSTSPGQAQLTFGGT